MWIAERNGPPRAARLHFGKRASAVCAETRSFPRQRQEIGCLPHQNAPMPEGPVIQRMFAEVADGYDRANRVLSLGIDVLWRKRAARIADL